MADSVGAGGASGSSGVLSSAMRSITRMAGDPHDRDARRVEDVVDLSPKAIDSQATDRPIEPASSSESLRNPPAFRQEQALREAEAQVDEAQEALEEASLVEDTLQVSDQATSNGPENIGLAAAIAVGLPEMVQRFDMNGDEALDQRERERAIRSVQSDSGYDQVRGGSPHAPDGEAVPSGDGEGAEAYAELQARRTESAQFRAEEAERHQRQQELVAELESDVAEPDVPEAVFGVAGHNGTSDEAEAYARSVDLGAFPGMSRSVSA